MSLNKNKILYISLHNPEIDPGVENKIQGICSAATKEGYFIERITQPCRSVIVRRKVIHKALRSDAAIFIIRSFGIFTIAILDLLIKARRQGRMLICDQPTPLSATIKEVWLSHNSFLKKIYNSLWGYISGPWSMWVYNRIIQYAQDSWYFFIANKKRTRVIGNGISVSSAKLRNHKNGTDENIRLIGVANLSVSHGFDRIIKAIAILKRRGKTVNFLIIGGKLDSPLIRELMILSERLGVRKQIEFVGFKNHDYILEAYNSSDLAVGALGLFRKGLNSSSILKIREYCLSGIPFITAGDDPDFPNDVPFRFLVPNDESIEPIVEAIESFPEKRKLFTDEEIRDYAVRHFSFEKKFKQMIDGLI